MQLTDITLLYNYNFWANARLLAAAKNVSVEQFLADAEFPYGGLRSTLTHVLEAEYIWRMRFEGQGHLAEEIPPTAFPALEALAKRMREEEQAMRAYLASLHDGDLEKSISYPIDEGKTRERMLWHCLVHVVNHGTQHRSEAAALLTRYGCSPGDLDFTVFLNEAHPPRDSQ
jgi:uncharacterized damage-inducible protein DinB